MVGKRKDDAPRHIFSALRKDANDLIWQNSERGMVVIKFPEWVVTRSNPYAASQGVVPGVSFHPVDTAFDEYKKQAELVKLKLEVLGYTGLQTGKFTDYMQGGYDWFTYELFRISHTEVYCTYWRAGEAVRAQAEVKSLKLALEEILKNNRQQIETELTESELAVAKLIREGKSTKQIADSLHISVRTVEFHRNNLRKKMNIPQGRSLRTHLSTLIKP